MAEIGTVKPEQEEEDDYAGYYKWNDVQPIHIHARATEALGRRV